MYERRQLLVAGALAFCLSLGMVVYVSNLETLSLGPLVAPLWVFAALAAAVSPRVFVFMLLAVSTNGFGFIDMSQELTPDLHLGDLSLLSLCSGVVSAAIIRTAARRFSPSFSVYSLLALLLLVLVAIACGLTSIRWGQEIWLSIKAARDFLFYAIVLLGSLLAFSEQNTKAVARAIVLAGVLSSAVSIIGFFVDLSPFLPGISTRGAGRSITAIEFYRTFNPGYAVNFLALFLAFFDKSALRPGTRIAVLAVTGLATVMMGFRAFWLGVLGAILWITFFDPNRRALLKASARRAIGAALVLLVLLTALNAQQVVTHRVAVIEEELGRTQSLGYRVEVIRGLWSLFLRNPLVGVGFAHPEGAGAALAASVGLPSTATIDVGWIDLLVKFGLVGGLALTLLARRLLRELRRETRPGLTDIATATRAYFIMGVFALPGAALFTWPGGILPLSVALLSLEAARSHGLAEALAPIAKPALSPLAR